MSTSADGATKVRHPHKNDFAVVPAERCELERRVVLLRTSLPAVLLPEAPLEQFRAWLSLFMDEFGVDSEGVSQ